MNTDSRSIGVFDSGVGGLSVLQGLQSALPNEHFIYVADSENAPYGERGDHFVAQRTHAITDYLREQHHIKALVVACNTATAAAIHEVRARYPDLPLVGLEPALKPAAALTHTGRVGVIGTRGTLTSSKFEKLLHSLHSHAEFVIQPCDGLAHAIERSTEEPLQRVPAAEAGCIDQLCRRYIGSMGEFGDRSGQIDILVLGCTHYIFARDTLAALVGPAVQIIDTAAPVARQTQRLLEHHGLSAAPTAHFDNHVAPRVQLHTTGALPSLQAAAARWLGLPGKICHQVTIP